MRRNKYLNEINQAFATHPVVALIGPRQCGKTTLAKEYALGPKRGDIPEQTHFFDLENPEDLALFENPLRTLEDLQGWIMIDEIQRRPNLFPVLRVLVDRKLPQRYLILGSASRDLLHQSSETLAGRIAYRELTPFTLQEIDAIDQAKLWTRGGFPRSFLAADEVMSQEWRKAYITTFLEKDIPSLGFQVSSATLRRFWLMLAHYHAQIFNGAEIGRSLGVSHTAIRHYLEILTGTFMVRELKPWINHNLKKRQVKSPKIYFRDSGIFHSLLGVGDQDQLRHHPKLGASWEGFALEEVIRYNQVDVESCYFWATHTGAELDLFIYTYGKKMGFEFKYSDAPKLTPSMSTALETLELDFLTVITPGHHDFWLSDRVRAVGLTRYLTS